MTTPAVVPSLPVADRLAPPTPADPKDVMARGKKVAAALRRFVKAHPEQVVQIDGNSHPRAEAWQFVAACYGHSAMVTSTQEILEQESGFIAVAHLREPGGQIVSGAEAVCMRSENKWREAESFQLRSMAQTRACAKVTRNVFAWVMVLAGFSPTPAEELENGHVAFDEIKSAPAPRAGKVPEKLVTQKQIRAFSQACDSTGKSADEVSGYLLTAHKATTIEELKRGKPFTEALRWAETRSTLEIVKPGPQPAQKMLDLIPKHKDAYSL